MTKEELKRKKAEEKKKQAFLLGVLFFRVPQLIQKQQVISSSTIGNHFEDVDDLIESGAAVKKAVKGTGEVVAQSLKSLIQSAIMNGYQDGIRHSHKLTPKNQVHEMMQLATKRANKVGKFMEGATKRMIKANPDDTFTLSMERAERAVQFEGRKAYYQGVLAAFGGSMVWLKEWVLHPEHDNDDICDDNADDGPIPVDEPFQSGDMAPGAHLNCVCDLSIRMKP